MQTEDAAREEREHDEYILGTDSGELDRLRLQHHVWLKEQLALLERAGVAVGQAVLDLGCGPGFTTLELARAVGPGGRVVARDLSERFLAFLGRECERLGVAHVETSEGPAEELPLEGGSIDVAYARWLLCWLPDLGSVLAELARVLRPGGTLLVQDYLEWGSLGTLPDHPSFLPARKACLASWKANGVAIDVVRRLPEAAERAGFEVLELAPIARVGRPGSPVWSWIHGFLTTYLPRCAEAGLLTRAQLAAWRRDWDARLAERRGWIVAPTMADVVLRRR